MHDRKNSRADRRLLRPDASGTNNFGVTLEVFLDDLSELGVSAAIGLVAGRTKKVAQFGTCIASAKSRSVSHGAFAIIGFHEIGASPFVMRAIKWDLTLFCYVVALTLSTSVFAALPGVTEFKTAPEQLTDADLSTLLNARVAPADVVALGETVHGSSGLLKIQTRLIRYLVSRHGYRLIVWENPTLRSLELARWVASCTTSKTAPPVDVLYMPTPSDVPLLEWICDFNRAQPNDPVVFRGMDIWDRPWEHYARLHTLGSRLASDPAILARIRKLCPAHDVSSWAEIEVVLAKVSGAGKFLPEADYERCRTSLVALIDSARESAKARMKTKDGGADDAFELALSASTILGWLGFYNFNWSDDILSWNARDEAQGRNLMLLMEKHRASRAIVAAHTSHVSHNRSRADWWGFGDIKSGISFFTGMTKKKVFNIAFTAYEASGTQGAWSLPTARNSLDKKLHDAGHLFSFFFSNAAFLSEHPRWWIQNQNYPGPYESGVEVVPRDHFDAFFFLGRSHLDKALPTRPMWEP
jgi:erythromycin esterase-like protein